MMNIHEKTAALFELARAQASAVTHRQLVELGFTRGEIAHRVRNGMLERILPRTYLVGGAPLDRRAEMSAAAQWAKGAISHVAAAVERGYLKMWTPPKIEVTTPKSIYEAAEWIVLHRTSYLPEDHVEVVDGVRITDPERTIMDIASCVGPVRLGMAIDAALHLGQLTVESLERRLDLDRRSGLDGVVKVEEALAKRNGHFDPGHSGLETIVYEILSHPSMPPFERHYKVDSGNGYPLEFDAAWPEFVAFGEIQDHGTHGSEHQQEIDRQKREVAQRMGGIVIEMTRKMAADPEGLRATVREILEARRAIGDSARGGA